ncbi:head maturation protease, ClpP-related [Streptomyces sp. NPDC058289]|uniref:head maturation protease, ClpP-related n=1 Tax=Streptomyces sp. NPDC058289 TaxID=3346425 RepID=UPI0036EC1C2F
MTDYPRSWRINARAGTNVPAPPTGRDWYRIRNATSTTAEILMYDEIGYYGVTAKDFASALSDVTASSIDIRISSPGGDVMDGLAIYQALLRHPAKVTAYIDGIAASIASVIAMAGDRRVIGRNSSFMIHDASALCVGQSKDMRETAQLLEKISNNIADVYAHRTGVEDAEHWRSLMKAETWWTGAEAVKAGLATEVDDGNSAQTEDAWATVTAKYKGGLAEQTEWARLTAHLTSSRGRDQVAQHTELEQMTSHLWRNQ